MRKIHETISHKLKENTLISLQVMSENLFGIGSSTDKPGRFSGKQSIEPVIEIASIREICHSEKKNKKPGN